MLLLSATVPSISPSALTLSVPPAVLCPTLRISRLQSSPARRALLTLCSYPSLLQTRSPEPLRSCFRPLGDMVQELGMAVQFQYSKLARDSDWRDEKLKEQRKVLDRLGNELRDLRKIKLYLSSVSPPSSHILLRACVEDCRMSRKRMQCWQKRIGGSRSSLLAFRQPTFMAALRVMMEESDEPSVLVGSSFFLSLPPCALLTFFRRPPINPPLLPANAHQPLMAPSPTQQRLTSVTRSLLLNTLRD